MNNTNEKENNLFKKFAAMMWILHRYHQKNHHKSENMRNSYEKYAESRILALLKLQEEVTKKDLMFILGIPKQQFEEVFDKMNKEECISFTDSESDSDIIVKLTEKGKTSEIKEEKSGFNSIFDCLTDEEKGNLGQYIDTIVSSVKTKFKDDSDEEPESFDDFHRGSFHGKDFRQHDMRGKDFHGSFMPDHRMDRDFRGGHDRHFSFDRDREFGGFDRRHAMENERCGYGHGPHGHPGFDRNREFDGFDRRRHAMENERCGHGHGPHGHPDFDRNREFGGFDRRRHAMENERCGHGHGPHGRPDFDSNREFDGFDQRCSTENRRHAMKNSMCKSRYGFHKDFEFFKYKGR